MHGSDVIVLALLSSSAETKEPLTVDILLGEHDLKVSLKEHEHRPVIAHIEVGKLLWMRVGEPVLSEDLDDQIPSPCDRLVYAVDIGAGNMIPPSPFPQPLAHVVWQRCLGIGVDGSYRSGHP